jgi:Lrp/AsnC family transcriptional regulator, leucine-responsive regulatory protein
MVFLAGGGMIGGGSWRETAGRVLANCAGIDGDIAISCRSSPAGWETMPKPDLDAIDCRILAALQTDGRLSNVDLADRVGLSPSPCLRRVNRLEREGYIDGYRAVLGRRRIGLGLTVFVGVKMDGHADERADALHEAFVALPEIVACHVVAGEDDFLLEVVVPDLEQYQHFLLGKLLTLPIIKEVRSTIAIQTLKTTAPLPLDHLGGP